jgi:hypothetical protein
MQSIDLVHCELSDQDVKQVLDLLRLLTLKDVHRLDLRRNLFTSKIVDVLAAFVIGIAGVDLLNRAAPLDIDLLFNRLNTKSVELLAAKIRRTPRPEVKLVVVEDQGQVIRIYGVHAALIRIDCRNNGSSNPTSSSSSSSSSHGAKAPSLRARLSLGSNVTDSLQVAYPGDDMDARNPNYYEGTVYPRDEILNYKTM